MARTGSYCTVQEEELPSICAPRYRGHTALNFGLFMALYCTVPNPHWEILQYSKCATSVGPVSHTKKWPKLESPASGVTDTQQMTTSPAIIGRSESGVARCMALLDRSGSTEVPPLC